jgi:hypothetical protein
MYRELAKKQRDNRYVSVDLKIKELEQEKLGAEEICDSGRRV